MGAKKVVGGSEGARCSHQTTVIGFNSSR